MTESFGGDQYQNENGDARPCKELTSVHPTYVLRVFKGDGQVVAVAIPFFDGQYGDSASVFVKSHRSSRGSAVLFHFVELDFASSGDWIQCVQVVKYSCLKTDRKASGPYKLHADE